MTKRELAHTIAAEMGLSRQQSQVIVQRVFDRIVETLLQKGHIELRNFGIFKVKKRKSRKAHIPQTGERIRVGAKLVVTFKAGLDLARRVRQLKTVPSKK